MDILEILQELGTGVDDALERFMDDEEMYLKYVKSFPKEPTMGRLIQAVNDKDYEQAEKSVHAFKGLVNNLGFLPLADAAIDMLEELRDDNVKAALEAYEEIKVEYQKYCNAIETWTNQG